MIRTAEEFQRRFSVEEDFMKYDTDDLLYGAMQHLATFHPAINRLYLTKKNYAKYRKDLCNLCGTTTRTLKNHLDKLIEKGLVAEMDIKSGDEQKVYPSYVFPYDKDKRYQLINNEMLWYIITTRSHQAVRIYVLLLSWYRWKQKENDTFIFTVKGIMEALGYSTKNDNQLVREQVQNILESFRREGVIDYTEFYEEYINDNGQTLQTPRKRLIFVAASKKEMK